MPPATSVSSTASATNSTVQTAVPKLSPTSNAATQASSLLPSVTSFVSQAGTLTLRISPPAASSVTNQTTAESKTTSSSSMPATAANLIPLQSGSFALLQLPGQKTVPNSILNHFASLQMKKDYRKICKKDDSGAAKQKENEKASHSDDTEVTEPEITVSDMKQEEDEFPVSQLDNTEESPSGTITPDKNSTMLEKDSKVMESSCDDSTASQHDASADIVSSDHSYISEKPNDEEEASEEMEDPVSSEAGVEAVNSETVCELSDQSLVPLLDNTHPQCLENQETTQLKNHGEEQIHAEQEGKPVKEEEGDAQTQMNNKVSSGQSQSQEQDTQVENKTEQRGTNLSQNKQEHQRDAVQPDVERKNHEDSAEAESIGEKIRIKTETSSAGGQNNASGAEHGLSAEEGKANTARQEGNNNKEDAAFDSQDGLKTGHDIVTHVNSSWSKISSIVPTLENKSNVENKADTSEKSDFLAAEWRTQEPRCHRKDFMAPVDVTADDTEEDDEEDEDDDDEEDEKTDDSADEMLDGGSDYASEEEVDIETVVSI